jgi:hypothetical protein
MWCDTFLSCLVEATRRWYSFFGEAGLSVSPISVGGGAIVFEKQLRMRACMRI